MLILASVTETKFDTEKKLRGRLQSPITEQGKENLRDVAQEVRPYLFGEYSIFTASDDTSVRSLELVIGRRITESEVTDALLPRSGGEYEGETYKDLRQKLAPKKYRVWDRDFFETPQFGESYYDIYERVLPFLREQVYPTLRKQNVVLVVATAEVLRVILGIIQELDFEEIPAIPIEEGVPYVFNGIVS